MTNANTATNSTFEAKRARINSGLKDLYKTVEKLGDDARKGMDSLPALAMAVTKGSHEGIIEDDFVDAQGFKCFKDEPGAEKHVRVVYRKYLDKVNSSANRDNSNSFDANVSKLNSFVRLGKLPNVDPVNVLARAGMLRSEQLKTAGDRKMHSAYPFYVKVAREQLKTPDVELTDEQMLGYLFKEEKAEDDDAGEQRKASPVEKMQNAFKAFDRAAEDLKDEDGRLPVIDAALDAMAAAIREAGGNVPARIGQEVEKAQAEAGAELAKLVSKAREMGLDVKALRALIK